MNPVRMEEECNMVVIGGTGVDKDKRRQLKRKVRVLLAGSNGVPNSIVRASVRLPAMNPLRWLKSQPPLPRIYWADRGKRCEVAGLGEADVVCASSNADWSQLVEQLGSMLSECPASVRYYGGMRFDPTPDVEEKWKRFGAYRFVLPRFELHADAAETTLYCNLVPARDRTRQDEICATIDTLAECVDRTPASLPTPVGRANRPGMKDWCAMVAWALKAFEEEDLDKVVLAREACFSFAEPLEPLSLLEQLAAGTPNCFHYLFQPQGGPAFVGASPERLFCRRGREMESEAVAGTRPRGTSATDDARLWDELLHSEKELREHEFVRMSLREELQPLAVSFRLDAQPSEMRLANGRHLVSRVSATLQPGVTSLDMLRALHPTSAVGGYPTRPALRAIRAQEPFDRGWYAGPVGWIGPNQADFAVGIRSGLINGCQLSLYSGAGIVLGSTPQAEWEEMEHKIQDFTNMLGMASPLNASRRAPRSVFVAGAAY